MAVRIMLVLAVLAIFYGCGQSSSAPDQGGKMAIESGVDIWTMNANGSSRTSLTRSLEVAEKDPVWSPDGRKIAFTSTFADEGAQPQLYVMNADGSDRTFLRRSPALHPTWSPDGKKIAFSTALRLPAYLNPAPGNIWIVNADGSGEPRRLTTDPDLYEYPAWSPDGKKIAFVRDGNIYVIGSSGAEGGAKQPRLLTDHVRGRPVDLSWSPDGAEIAFASVTAHRLRYEEQDVYKMDADGSSVTHLTHGRGSESSPTWSPSGDRIVFARFHPGPPGTLEAIFVMNADGTDLAPLGKNFESGAQGLDWWGTARSEEQTKNVSED